VAFEKPQLWHHIQLGDNLPLTAGTAILGDTNDAIKHEHWWQWQLGVTWTKQFATPTLK
jgi:hypothetical protein